MPNQPNKRPARSPRSRTKGLRPEGPLAEEALKRGQQAYNLWYAYAPKIGGDVVLKGDAEFLHFMWMELDPNVEAYRLESPTAVVTIPVGSRATTLDADVTLRTGAKEFREVKSVDDVAAERGTSNPDEVRSRLQRQAQEQLAALHGAAYRRIGPTDLRANANLIATAMIAVATLSAARTHSIERHHVILMALMNRRSHWQASALLDQVEVEEQPLLSAAIFRAAGRGELCWNCDVGRWSKATWLWLPASEPPTRGSDRIPPEQEGFIDRGIESRSNFVAIDARPSPPAPSVLPAVEFCVPSGGYASTGRYTRKNLPETYRNPQTWPTVDFTGWPEKQRRRFDHSRAAICGYLQGAPLADLEKAHDVHRAEIFRLLNRAVLLHPDGNIQGWRVLVPGSPIAPYQRSAPVQASGNAGIGYAGALQQLFDRFPSIRRALEAAVLGRTGSPAQEQRVSANDLHKTFIALCREQKLTSFDYPFNTESWGRRSIQKFHQTTLAGNMNACARIYSGDGRAKGEKLHNGQVSLLTFRQIYDGVQQDSHTVDAIGSVRIPHPSGPRRVPIQRCSYQAVVDCESGAVLGYSVSFTGRPNSADAVRAVKNALSIWQPITIESPVVPYPDDGGLPSGLIPELAGATWAAHMIDNDSTFTSRAMAERVRRRVGCAMNWGPVETWPRRALVEAVFGTLEKRGFQRLPSTTGSHPKDPRRRDAEKMAVDLQIDFSELIYLIDVGIATYNRTPLPRHGGRSPLEILRERVRDPRSGFIVRRLPPLAPGEPEMHLEIETPTVRGNPKEGRNPYVEIDEVHYTNSQLAASAHLIGQKISVHIDGEDMRTMQAFTSKGMSLGALLAPPRWRSTIHTREMRKAINRLLRGAELRCGSGQDYVQAYLQVLAERAAKKGAKHPYKINKAGTQAAKVSHQSGLPIPEIADPSHGHGEAGLRLQPRLRPPSFVKAPKRKAVL